LSARIHDALDDSEQVEGRAGKAVAQTARGSAPETMAAFLRFYVRELSGLSWVPTGGAKGGHAMKRLAVSGLALSVLGASPAFADMPPLSEQVAAIVQPQLDQYSDLSLGVVVGVVQPGTSGAVNTSIFYFGKLVDQNNNPIPLDGATEFEIGSVTKTFTATVLASQIQEQPWLLDLPINRIFPQTPVYKGQQITIRDLADYTSGLPDSNRDGGNASCTFDGATIEQCYNLSLLFQNLSKPKLSALQFAPGTQYLYSDLAVALLALAEPSLAGSQSTKPLQLLSEWEALVDSVVLQPLRMRLTHAFDPALDPALLPQGYDEDPSGHISPGRGHDTSWRHLSAPAASFRHLTI
jgi:CubicO group peptidase (beta-lactamase class C family)